jgi:hypothetical protein
LIHTGSIKKDTDNLALSLVTLEIWLGLRYQRTYFHWSLHTDMLLKATKYPVVRLFLDSDRINDPK